MAFLRRVPSCLLVLAALAVPAAGVAGCGSDDAPGGARVDAGAAPAREAAPDGSTARDQAANAGDGAPAGDPAQAPADGPATGAEVPAAGEPASRGPAAGGVDPGETPYEGDGDGDSSDDAPAAAGGSASSAPAGTGGVPAGAEAGAGDEEPAAVPAAFVLEDGGASPMRVEVPAFLGLALEVENAEGRAVQVRLRAPGAESFTVGPGQTVTRTVSGVPPGLYPLEVDGGASGAVVVAEG